MILLKNLNKWGGVILLLVMFVMFNSEAEADTTVTLITVGGCEYRVIVKYECSITAQTPAWFSVTEYKLVDSNCVSTLSPAQIPNALTDSITNNPEIYIWECNSYYKPCTAGWSEMSSIEYTCWFTTGNGVYTPCESSVKCITITEYCFNGISLEIGNSTVVNLGAADPDCGDIIEHPYCPGASAVITNCTQ